LKRLFDVLVLAVTAPIWMPVILATAVAVSTLIGRPIFFTQMRGGFECKPFKIWKFRSMLDVRGVDGALLPDADRITRFGRFLRAASLDELPCLWNLLKGDISIVGPRPFIADYLPLYSERQRRRHDVRPGITGWAQINGRNALSWEEKFELDLWYVDNRSFMLDIKILFQTALKVIARHGVSAENHETMPRFTGSKPLQ
jgi:lipopolysaccharide/colanic/teichoic acid biosynthesis glycosyltransferase